MIQIPYQKKIRVVFGGKLILLMVLGLVLPSSKVLSPRFPTPTKLGERRLTPKDHGFFRNDLNIYPGGPRRPFCIKSGWEFRVKHP